MEKCSIGFLDDTGWGPQVRIHKRGSDVLWLITLREVINQLPDYAEEKLKDSGRVRCFRHVRIVW